MYIATDILWAYIPELTILTKSMKYSILLADHPGCGYPTINQPYQIKDIGNNQRSDVHKPRSAGCRKDSLN